MRFFLLAIILGLIVCDISFAGIVEIPNKGISGVSITPSSGDSLTVLETTGYSLLRSAKIFLMGLFVIYMVYNGFQMMLAMGSDDDKIKRAKRQIRYGLVGIVFVNIPGSLYTAFFKESNGTIGGPITKTSWTSNTTTDNNIFFNFFDFGYTLNDNIVGFLQVAIFWIAIFMIVLSGIKMILAGRDTKVDIEGKKKILYSVIALILVGFIEAWKNFAFKGKISDGADIFRTLANLILFFAGPIAIVFLTMAAYYYITSGGNEEKVKKAKSIITYVVIGTLIMLAAYTFLIELNGFSI